MFSCSVCCVCLFVCLCVYAYVRACMHVCLSVCMYVRTCVHTFLSSLLGQGITAKVGVWADHQQEIRGQYPIITLFSRTWYIKWQLLRRYVDNSIFPVWYVVTGFVFYQTQVHRLKAQMEKMEDAESEASNTRTENETIRRWVDREYHWLMAMALCSIYGQVTEANSWSTWWHFWSGEKRIWPSQAKKSCCKF